MISPRALTTKEEILCIVTVRHAHRWISMDYLHSEPHAPIALNVTVAATRRRQVRRSARPREYLTEREIENLIDAAGGNRWDHRDATAVLLAYRHGLRASELVALRGMTSTSRPASSMCAAPRAGHPAFIQLVGANSGPCAVCSARANRPLCIRF
jgi:hypothetical protein